MPEIRIRVTVKLLMRDSGSALPQASNLNFSVTLSARMWGIFYLPSRRHEERGGESAPYGVSREDSGVGLDV
jgi:hypothetical protein